MRLRGVMGTVMKLTALIIADNRVTTDTGTGTGRVLFSGPAVRPSLSSPGIGDPEARLRVASRTLQRSVYESVATSCRNPETQLQTHQPHRQTVLAAPPPTSKAASDQKIHLSLSLIHI